MNDLDKTVLDRKSFCYLEIVGQKSEWTPRQNPRVVTTSGNVNSIDDLVRVNCTAGSVTMTLETAVGCDGRQHTFKKTDASANSMVVACTGSETIDGASTLTTVTRYTTLIVKSNGTTWDLISSAVSSTPGTVTTVSVATANGVSGSVANATTTPAITLTLGAITPTTVTPSGLVDISAAGAGQIKFPATQNASSDANTLDDYEKGTWTPIDSSGAALSLSSASGTYTKVGRKVSITGVLTYPVTVDGTQSKIGGLPFAQLNTTGAQAGNLCYATIAAAISWVTNQNATTGQFVAASAAILTNAQMSAGVCAIGATYPTA